MKGRIEVAIKTVVYGCIAAAAGVTAFAFACIALFFWAQQRYRALGFQLFAVLVIAYMFKDRLKEATRQLFSRLMERTYYDRKRVRASLNCSAAFFCSSLSSP